MDRLDILENQSIFIIREAFAQFRKVAMLWSVGKDSTTLLWLIRKAFLGKVPFPVIHIDTSYKFKEIYEFRDRLAVEWQLDLRIARNELAIKNGMGPEKSKFNCCMELKTNALKMALESMVLKHCIWLSAGMNMGSEPKKGFFLCAMRIFSGIIKINHRNYGSNIKQP